MFSRTRAVILVSGLFVALLAGPALLAEVTQGDVQPSHSVRFEVLTRGGSRFLNYDGRRNFKTRDRDWPINFVFYHAASVNKVKDVLVDLGMFLPGDTEYEGYRYSPGSFRRFDSDKGKKGFCDENANDNHLRIYATVGSDRFFDPRYGFFVVASSHQDHADGCGDPDDQFFGYSEIVEERIADQLRRSTSLVVHEDYIPMNNHEDVRTDPLDPRHIWYNSGRATAVRIPCGDNVCP